MNKVTTVFLIVVLTNYWMAPLFSSRESRRESNLPNLYDTNRERVQGSILGPQQYYYYQHNPRFTPQTRGADNYYFTEPPSYQKYYYIERE